MKIEDALQNVTRLFLDSAPVIYYVEEHPRYISLMDALFEHIETTALTTVASPVTLAECLVVPIRAGLTKLQQNYSDLLLHGPNTMFVPLDELCAQQAAQLRARYNLRLLDALQIAAALTARCEALVTNDAMFQRVTELRVLMIDDLEL